MAASTDDHREDGRNHRDSAEPVRAHRASPGDLPTPTTPAQRWTRERTFHHSLYSVERIARARGRSVSVCLPAKECAGTVGAIVAEP